MEFINFRLFYQFSTGKVNFHQKWLQQFTKSIIKAIVVPYISKSFHGIASTESKQLTLRLEVANSNGGKKREVQKFAKAIGNVTLDSSASAKIAFHYRNTVDFLKSHCQRSLVNHKGNTKPTTTQTIHLFTTESGGKLNALPTVVSCHR